MASNFDFLQKIDSELFEIIQDGEKLFRDGYFNQSIVQLRIFAEKMAKKTAKEKLKDKSLNLADSTFDDILNCLKDKIESEREKEFIDDLFFIKKEGNKCAHGEDADGLIALEAIKHAYEAAINYAWFQKQDEKTDKLQFDEALLVTQKKASETKIIDKYLKAANENLEAEKEKKELEKKEKELTKARIKQKVKEAKKARKDFNKPQKNEKKQENNKTNKEESAPKNKTERKNSKKASSGKKKTAKNKKNPKNNKIKILFWIFAAISLFFLTKMIFFF